jgi:hypothetical protein
MLANNISKDVLKSRNLACSLLWDMCKKTGRTQEQVPLLWYIRMHPACAMLVIHV